MSTARHGVQGQVAEWTLTSGKAYADPFNEVEIDVEFTGSGGTWRVPAFWSSGLEWRVRFAAPAPGTYHFRSLCADVHNHDLHGVEGTLDVAPYTGENALLKHGPLRVTVNRRGFEFADGTPFFWLGDTWWMGFTQRLRWPEEFQLLAADRVAIGFTVVQIVAGLYPDMPWHDPRGANEAGFPWDKEFRTINPAYFDAADLRVQWLVRSGLMPCIVGCWGYFLPWTGVERMQKHWRNLVARWGAYPVVWCLAGEGAMPYYLSQTKEEDTALQIAGWTEIGRHLRQIDPFHRPITIHPTNHARDQVQDDRVLDFDMLQTGHGGHDSLGPTVGAVTAEYQRAPHMPVVIGECNYEGILEGSREEVQRFVFWAGTLSGAAGFTYGANGIWQLNSRAQPYGPSPWGGSWGNQPWEDAYRLPGSAQVGLGKRLLERMPWHRFQPRPDWVDPHGSKDNYRNPYAAGIPRELRVVYLPGPVWPWGNGPAVTGLEPDVAYRAYFLDPKNGNEVPLGMVAHCPDGRWSIPMTPVMQDWVLVLERTA